MFRRLLALGQQTLHGTNISVLKQNKWALWILGEERFLSCCGLRITPYGSMNITFLVYSGNAVYQICTSTVQSHGPDKGTISEAAVPG